MLEQIIQITVILTFIASIVCFFIKLGEYKSLVNTDIKTVQEDLKTLQDEVKDMKDEVDKIKEDTNKVTSNLEALLIELRTKVDFLIQGSGIFNNEKFKK